MERPKILAVEDDVAIADLINRGLAEEGFDVHVAHRAAQRLSRKLNSRVKTSVTKSS